MDSLEKEQVSEIRVIAPSYGWEPGFEERDEKAKSRLESLGYELTFGDKLKAHEYHLGTASAAYRVADFHEAYTDPNVKAVMAYSGGWSSNEILRLIDWELVKANPKPVIGMSDITVLINAIYAKTGNVGFLAPNFGLFGLQTGWQYALENFRKVLTHEFPYDLKPSTDWNVEAENDPHATEPWKAIQDGEAEGYLIGGAQESMSLLQGTEFMPKFDKPFILVVEEPGEGGALTARFFSRKLESFLQLPGARQNLRGVLIGRFIPKSQVTFDQVVSIIGSKMVGDVPVVANMDFGHTIPQLTLPIGEKTKISVQNGEVRITLL